MNVFRNVVGPWTGGDSRPGIMANDSKRHSIIDIGGSPESLVIPIIKSSPGNRVEVMRRPDPPPSPTQDSIS